MTKLATAVMLAFAAGVIAAPPAFSQDYPTKTVRIIVGFSPGGGNDITARILAKFLGDTYKQQFIVENRPGAGTIIGVDAVAKADPDGYTLLVTNNSLAVNHTLYPKLPYDTLKDIAPIVKAGSTPNVLVIHPSLPVKTVAAFITLAKAQPDRIAYASAGTGSTAFLAAELLKMLTGIKMLHVPYKGTSPAITSILSGETQALVGALPATVPHIKNGRLRALAVTSAKRATAMKEIPTMIESGVKDFDFETWYGVFGPGKLPRDLVARLNASVNKVIAQPAVREQFERQGIDTEGGTTETFDKQVRAEIAAMAKVIKASGAKPE
ncbi:MAG: tripartite tricarboxylate transporter substrate binding protein [Burkholderiales bacterium]|nr:tripartite tricarboxylate transporter substrate binding protein [Burkholderiales bacterium]